MKRLLLVLTLTLLLLSSYVFADHWTRTRTLPEGLYVICVILVDNSPLCGPVAYIDGTDDKTQELCDILNDEPMTMPGNECLYFLWQDGEFVRQLPPCAYLPDT